MFLLTFKLPSKIYVIFQNLQSLVFIQDYSEPSPMSNTLLTLTHLICPKKEVFLFFWFSDKETERSKTLSNLSTESRVQILTHFVVVLLHSANHISPLQRVIRLLVFDTGTIMLVKN